MIELGPIVRLQIQTQPLKTGDGDNRWYNTRWIEAVSALRLTRQGVVGLVEGEERLDAHHRDHPQSRNRQHRGSANGISFNVTPHYAQIGRQFGEHMWPGSGGENILIESAAPVTAADFRRGLLLQTTSGLVHLTQIAAAEPCVPVARFALDKPHRPAVDLVKNALVFLGDGMRGFYAAYEGAPSYKGALVELRLGDWVYLPV